MSLSIDISIYISFSFSFSFSLSMIYDFQFQEIAIRTHYGQFDFCFIVHTLPMLKPFYPSFTACLYLNHLLDPLSPLPRVATSSSSSFSAAAASFLPFSNLSPYCSLSLSLSNCTCKYIHVRVNERICLRLCVYRFSMLFLCVYSLFFSFAK